MKVLITGSREFDKTFWWRVWLEEDYVRDLDTSKFPRFKTIEEAITDLLRRIVERLQARQKEALEQMDFYEKQMGFQRWVMQEYRKAELQMGTFNPQQENLPFPGEKK